MGRSDRSGRDFAMAASCAKRPMTTGKALSEKLSTAPRPKQTLSFSTGARGDYS